MMMLMMISWRIGPPPPLRSQEVQAGSRAARAVVVLLAIRPPRMHVSLVSRQSRECNLRRYLVATTSRHNMLGSSDKCFSSIPSIHHSLQSCVGRQVISAAVVVIPK